jgi:peptidyl-prolyl cis-trans isomerase C
MKKKLFCAAVALLALGSAPTLVAQQSPTDVVVIVNDEPILAWEIGLLIPQIQNEMTSQGLSTEGDAVIVAAMRRAVDARLLAQEARRRKLEPDADRVNQTVTEIEANAGGRTAFDANLAKFGVTNEQFRAAIRQSDLVQVFIQSQIESLVAVSGEEVDAFFVDNPEMFQRPEQVRARHILIKVEDGATPAQREEAMARATAARERAVAGEDFAALAIELSEGATAPHGGDLGWASRGQMVASFDDAVWALEVGEISGVVESKFGYHVIKLEAKRAATAVPLEEARPNIENLLRQERTGEALSVLLKALNEQATIVDPNQPAAAVTEGAANGG